MPDQPNLGYDKTSEVDLNTFNQWFRARPEYYAKLAEWGQDPNNVHLSDSQKQEMVRLAQSLGAVVDEGGSGQEVDDSGNFRNKSHKLKTGLIIAGIAGAALATAGAAGLFSGAAAPAAAGGLTGVEAGATAGLGTAALPGAMATLPAVGLGGVEAGAAAGLGAAALPGAGTALDAGGTLAGVGAAAGEEGMFDAAGNFLGEGSLPGGVGSFDAAATAGGSSLGKTLGKALGTFGDVAGSVGQAIGKANTAAGNNRLDQEHAGLTANAQNITGNSAFEQELMNRAKEEDVQRNKAAKDVYRASYNANPRVSPFDPVGAPKYSDQYRSVAQGLADQGADTLKDPALYATRSMPALKPYTDIDPKDVQGATGSEQGTLSKIGDYLGPGLTVAQQIARLWGGK